MKNLSQAARPDTRGAALIIVLSLIVLMAAVVTAFLVRAGMERSASASYDAAASTRLLAETTVNLVQGTINQATTEGTSKAWASQPGAIRVFSNSGALERIYRLYSSSELASDTSTGSILANDIPPDSWASQPSVWVDLNKPVTVSGVGGTTQSSEYLAYPILDPRDPLEPGSSKKANVLTKLDGFSIDSSTTPGSTDIQPAPMPVKWLYVLRDGKIVDPVASGSNGVAVNGASASNPITGRIAFWTDDETTKVNVNTAAGSRGAWKADASPIAASWDVPRFRMAEDRQIFAYNQPVQGEYQRYPGHPGTTDLYNIYKALNLPTSNYPYPFSGSSTGTQSDFFSLSPRYNDNAGSKGASVDTATGNKSPAITSKSDRLYTSVGELLFKPDRKSNGVNRQQVETGKFFLTGVSRAPDVTLFGTPRVAIWPIDSDYGKNPTTSNTTKLVTTFDKLIAFCTSTGSGTSLKQFYFQRHDSTSPTNDWTQISRNQLLYAYLQRLTGLAIPGFGGNFGAKYSYSGERDQILTEIVDYIRCTNLYDHSTKDPVPDNPLARFTPRSNNASTGGGQVVPLQINNTRGLGRMYTISELGLLLICTADGNGENGDWREQSNTTNNTTLSDVFTTEAKDRTKLNPGEKRLQAMLLIELSAPMHGFDPIMPDISVNMRGLGGITFKRSDGVFLKPFQSGDLLTLSPGIRFNGVNMTGGLNGFQYFMSRLDYSSSGNNRLNAWSNPSAKDFVPYRFVSNPFTVNTNQSGNGFLEISTAEAFTAEVLVKEKGGSSRRVVQTFNISFPPATIPIPDLIKTGTGPSSAPDSVAGDWWSFDNRIKWASNVPGSVTQNQKGVVIRTDSSGIPDSANVGTGGSDVVRSLVANQGDVRLVMAKETVNANEGGDMTTTPGYYDSNVKLAHIFMQANSSNLVPGVNLGGKLVKGANYEAAWVPKVPSNVQPQVYWDWDSGLPGTRDGAYANKPDEGNIYTDGSSAPYYNGENQVNNNNVQNIVSYFTANRIIPSAVMFGSLPTGVKQGVPWRTLLFRPQANRPDPAGPKDHLILDLFTMPVVEPYAISEPFSTAGKVNMNYQIVPFTYINRSTGVRAVLASELIARVPRAAAQKRGTAAGHSYYKIPYGNSPGLTNDTIPGAPSLARLPLNLSETNGTLRQFREKFQSWDIFRSPSEICDIYLVPQGYSWNSDNAAETGWYGDDFALVGDNVRERPYAAIYPRLTTKSNTFTVHYTVQSLKNPPSQDQGKWNESGGVVTGELRGSSTIERFIDPADPNIPDYATDANAPSLDTFYQWRVISNTTFAP